MKLQVQSYNGDSSYNPEEEETNFRFYTIDHEFNEPAKAIITLADKDGSRMHKYKADAQVAIEAFIDDDGGVQSDDTTDANDPGANDFPLTPPNGGNTWDVNDATYFGFSEEVGGMRVNVGTALVPSAVAPVVAWEYWDGDSWETLADISDGPDRWTVSGEGNVSWTIPGDWATTTVNSQGPFYYVRSRVTTGCDIDTQALGTQVWYNRIWIGPGKITIEDPDGTDMFFGRIMKVTGDYISKTVILECVDWLSQLDEKQITYDMREDLDSDDDTGQQGLRESGLHADADNATIIDVAYNDGGGNFYVYDDDRSWNADEFNNKYLVLSGKMAGRKKWTFYPYDSTATDEDVYTDDVELVWIDDDREDVGLANNDWTLDYHFRVYLGHNTPSDFYVHDSITGARVKVVHQVDEVPSTNHCHLQIYENDTPAWVELEHIEEQDVYHRNAYEVNVDWLPHIVDNTGIVNVRNDLDRAAGNVTIRTRYLVLELDVETTGYSSAISITDTLDLNGHGGKVNCLKIGTDMTAAATRVWEGLKYSIAKPIYLHIESATGPILGGDGIVTLTCGAANVENTSGISTRQYKEKTRLFVSKDLAMQDKAVFWITLGGTTVTYKQTFGADTQQLTDGDILSWQSLHDYNQLTNEYHVYGARIGDYEIYQSQQNAASVAKYNATRTKTLRDAGLVSDADAKERATTLAARDADLSQMISCSIAGNTATAGHATTIKLGEIVEITSSYLWPTAAKDYIVTRFSYDSAQHKTFLTLHPKVSIGLQEIDSPHSAGRKMKEGLKTFESDKYIADPITHEVA